MTNLKEGQILKHKQSGRLIRVIAVNPFKNTETEEEESFCSYYWYGFHLIGTDLTKDIEEKYKLFAKND